VIAQVSRMERWKAHRVHLAALEQLREVPNWIAWFVGGAQNPDEVAYGGEVESGGERTRDRLASSLCRRAPGSFKDPGGFRYLLSAERRARAVRHRIFRSTPGRTAGGHVGIERSDRNY
jgi:hypothetical protein